MRTDSPATHVPHQPLAALFTDPERQRYPSGRVFFEQGESASGVYILHSGEVALTRHLTEIDGGQWRRRIARGGEMLGLRAVLANEPHAFSAEALTDCETSFIDAAAFRRLIEQSPAAGYSVLRQLSQDVRCSYVPG